MKKFYKYILIVFLICFCAFSNPCLLYAQKYVEHDSSYFATYPGTLTARFYFSKKYTSFVVPASGDAPQFKYRPNTKLNMGIGATYKNLSLNIAYGFNFLNNNEEKGKTKSLDLQLHVYPDKWAIDVLGIFHSGLDFYTTDILPPDTAQYFYRPDVIQSFVGLSAFRVLNHHRFSYNAAMTQNEWQKKSAGTLLLGGHAYYGQIKADSAFITKPINSGAQGYGINEVNFFSIGPGIGYAYTLVVKKHFFITGSLIGSVNFIFSSEDGVNPGPNKVSANPGVIYKAAVGYNSDSWCITANVAANALWINAASSTSDYFLTTGNYRIILAKKIPLKKH